MTGTTLAPYAAHPEASRGRLHGPEPGDDTESPFVLDRERVIHCAAFRRLEYKTQVMVNHEGDHFRTRLTHTLEVAHLARRLARALHVNEELAEVVALTHDLGHPPFGHAGEAALRELMAGYGGFEHNVQSLRVVDYLEHPFRDYRGLNLSFEVRESLVKHSTPYDNPEPEAHDSPAMQQLFDVGYMPPIEGQLTSLADQIAYVGHDVEDAIGAGVLREKRLDTTALWRRAAGPIRRKEPDAALPAIGRPAIDAMVAHLLADVRDTSLALIRDAGVQSSDDVRQCRHPLVDFSPAGQRLVRELSDLLAEDFYHHHRLVRMDAKAQRFVKEVFRAYVEHPQMLPPRFADRVEEQGAYRVICDYVAGMTDRFCQDEYKRLFEPFERV
jgi:dGTPase